MIWDQREPDMKHVCNWPLKPYTWVLASYPCILVPGLNRLKRPMIIDEAYGGEISSNQFLHDSWERI